jgi:FMN phosphatase YigB (HAD superfamily)
MRTIVWDVDDVLNALMWDWFHQEWRPAHPDCALKYGGIARNPPHEVLGVAQAEYLESLDRFRLSANAAAMEPNPDVLAWFRSQGARCRHIALTARPLASAPAAAEWVMRHFGDYIRVFAVVPCRAAPGTPAYDITKRGFLEWWGKGDILVDDSPDNIAAAALLGVRGVLFPQPWNTSGATPRKALEALTAAVLEVEAGSGR